MSAANNSLTTRVGATNSARPVAASAMAATASSRFFISKGGNALNHPKCRDPADAVRRETPCPRWLRYSRAFTEPFRKRHDTQDRRDKEELADLHAHIEKQQRHGNRCLGKADCIQRACETESV